MKFDAFSIQTVTALPRFGEDDKIAVSSSTSEILPLDGFIALYINIPYCRTICRFCMLRKAAKINEQVPDDFIDLLIKEISNRAITFKDNKVCSVYFGGGTPSLLSAKQVGRILKAIYKDYTIANKFELSIEGEAKSFNRQEFLIGLKKQGFNRLSFGLQTLNDNMRSFLGRTDTLKDIFSLKHKLDRLDFDDINIDYLYNLPGTNPKYVEKDILDILKLNFTSIDCHPLKYISCSTKMLREIVDKNIPLPTRDERIDMYWLMRDLLLEEEGMSEQLVDQYTHTDVHTTNLYILSLNGLNSGQYAGFGPGARSHYGNFGMVNARSIHDYSNAINDHGNAIDVISKSDQIDNYITRLPKRNDKVSINEIALSTNMEFYNTTLNKLVQSGLMNFDKKNYYLTKNGLTWYQNLQELLLIPEQRDRHRKSTIIRSEKMLQFGQYFNDIGKSLNDVVC